MGLGVLTVGSVYLEKRSKRMLADEFSRLLNPTLYVSSLRQVAEYLPDFQRCGLNQLVTRFDPGTAQAILYRDADSPYCV